MWANINYLSAHNKPHTHPNSFFSGVYYVKTPNDCGRLTLEDPRPGPQHLMPVKKPGTLPKDFWKTLFIEPKEGRLIIFPSWLWHSVEENKSFNDRISVSFLIIFYLKETQLNLCMIIILYTTMVCLVVGLTGRYQIPIHIMQTLSWRLCLLKCCLLWLKKQV
jgi:hypothetical protein